MITIPIKPLSVNECWQGRRFKTDKYREYEKKVLLMLPKMMLPDPPYMICFVFGVSSSLCDYDNPIKPTQDIIVKKYGFDDRQIHRALIDKVLVPKGSEYFKFNLTTLPTED